VGINMVFMSWPSESTACPQQGRSLSRGPGETMVLTPSGAAPVS